jgi:hypothetical protein
VLSNFKCWQIYQLISCYSFLERAVILGMSLVTTPWRVTGLRKPPRLRVAVKVLNEEVTDRRQGVVPQLRRWARAYDSSA